MCSGTYDEQVIIGKPLTLKGVGGRGKDAAVIRPSHTIPYATALSENFLDGQTPIIAVITVLNTTDVVIDSLIVDGTANDATVCEPDLLTGVYFGNASGVIRASTVKDVRLNPNLGRCPSGIGIYIDSDDAGSSRVSVTQSSIHGTQLNAIAAVEPGTDLQARQNVITADDERRGGGHPGIGIGWGATGRLDENMITNCVFEGCNAAECPNLGVGVMAFFTENVHIVKNSVGRNHVGIFLLSTSTVTARENQIFDTQVFDGMVVLGDGNIIRGNRITDSDESGILIVGSDNIVRGNVIQDTPFGLITTGPYRPADNEFINTGVEQEILSGATAASRSAAGTGQPTGRFHGLANLRR